VDPSSDDRRHLAHTLLHSDVVVNVASTIAIEACLTDTPVVNIGFDGVEPRPFLGSAARYYRYTHYRPLVDAEAVRVAGSPEEMVSVIERYLAEPATDRAGRARAAEELCSYTDGRCSERVAEFVLRELARIPVGGRRPEGGR
jgi:CDP-glycerol glycerophosphotransferase (TagB/SpsB family)